MISHDCIEGSSIKVATRVEKTLLPHFSVVMLCVKLEETQQRPLQRGNTQCQREGLKSYTGSTSRMVPLGFSAFLQRNDPSELNLIPSPTQCVMHCCHVPFLHVCTCSLKSHIPVENNVIVIIWKAYTGFICFNFPFLNSISATDFEQRHNICRLMPSFWVCLVPNDFFNYKLGRCSSRGTIALGDYTSRGAISSQFTIPVCPAACTWD